MGQRDVYRNFTVNVVCPVTEQGKRKSDNKKEKEKPEQRNEIKSMNSGNKDFGK